MDEQNTRRVEEVTREKNEDKDRLMKLKLSNDEEAKRKLQEKLEYIDTQNKFMEYREKLKLNDKFEE
jgi:hypothetical protein